MNNPPTTSSAPVEIQSFSGIKLATICVITVTLQIGVERMLRGMAVSIFAGLNVC